MKHFVTYLCLAVSFGALPVYADNGYSAFGLRGLPAFGSKQTEGVSERILERYSAPVSSRLPSVRKGVRLTPYALSEDNAPEIYAWNIYSKNETPFGLYRLDGDNVTMTWADAFYDIEGSKLKNGFLRDGVLTGVSLGEFFGYVTGMWQVSYDFATGNVISSSELALNDAPYYERMAYNPEDGYVYGVGKEYHAGFTGYVFMRSAPDDLSTAEVISRVEDGQRLEAMCYCARDNAFYGANASGDFVRIDTDGTYTSLFRIDAEYSPIYFGALLYSDAEKIFYWSYSTDEESYLATIDDLTQKVNVYAELEYANQLAFYVTPTEPVLDPMQPLAPELAEKGFADGETSGFLSYTVPDRLEDGSAVSGEMTAVMMLDGNLSEERKCSPGETVRFEFTDLERGYHTFGMYVVCNGHQSSVCASNFFVGCDNPLPPADVALADGMLTWSPVTEGVNGGYVDAAGIRYVVSVNGSPVGDTHETEWKLELPQDHPLAPYAVTVTAVSLGYESDPSASVQTVAGKPLTLPMTIKPTAEEAAICTVTDNNLDNVYWLYSAEKECFIIGYSAPGIWCDDWLFMPPFVVEDASESLALEFETAIRSAMFSAEEMEVYVGKSPVVDDMTIPVVESLVPEAVEPSTQLYSYLFNVPEPGVYYVGFHLKSEPDQGGMILKNIRVEDNNIGPDSPAAPTCLSVKAGENGKLEAEVSFTFPTETFGGDALPAGEKLTAVVESAVGRAEVTGAPGETGVAVVATEQGDNHISVSVLKGVKGSPKATVSVYCGVYAPMHTKVTSISTSPDMMSVTITWDPVTTGVGGGFIIPEDVTYDIYTVVKNGGASDWKYLASAGSATSYTYDCPEGMPQQVLQIGVVAENAAGNDGYVASSRDLVGTPFALPMKETFNNSDEAVEPWVIYSPSAAYNAEWRVGSLESAGLEYEGCQYALIAQTSKGEGSKGKIGMPRFSTMGADAVTVELYMYKGSDSPKVSITGADYYATDMITLFTLVPSDDSRDFGLVEFELPAELLGKPWVQLYIDVEFNDYEEVAAISTINIRTGCSGVAEIAAGGSVRGLDGFIMAEGLAGKTLRVSDLSGRQILSTTVRGESAMIPASSGIYVVETDGIRRKIVVK